MVILSLELTRVNPDRNIFSIKCGTNFYFIYSTKDGPHRHHRNFKFKNYIVTMVTAVVAIVSDGALQPKTNLLRIVIEYQFYA